jgi:hypothetical protein
MFATLILSTTTYALDLARFFVDISEEKTVASGKAVKYLEILFFVFIGGTHLTADSLLVRSLG